MSRSNPEVLLVLPMTFGLKARCSCIDAINRLALDVALEVLCCWFCGLGSNAEYLQQSDIVVTFVL